MNKVLEADNIYFRYNSEINEYNIEAVSARINDGEFVAVLGPNGAGKSTFIKLLSGVLKPEKGIINLNGKKLSEYGRREVARNISFVPQSSGTAYPFSVFEIVMMGRSPYLNLWGREKPEDVAIVKEALNLVGIYNLRNKGINEISGGEAQRAYIARAFAQRTGIILLDEPNTHLDIEHQISIFSLLKKFNSEEKRTIITISHDLNLAGSFCDKCIIMKAGMIEHNGKVQEVITEDIIRSVFNVNSVVTKGDKQVSVSIKAS